MLQREPQKGHQPAVWVLQCAPHVPAPVSSSWLCPAVPSPHPGEGTPLCLPRSHLSLEPGSPATSCQQPPRALGLLSAPALGMAPVLPTQEAAVLCEWSPLAPLPTPAPHSLCSPQAGPASWLWGLGDTVAEAGKGGRKKERPQGRGQAICAPRTLPGCEQS